MFQCAPHLNDTKILEKMCIKQQKNQQQSNQIKRSNFIQFVFFSTFKLFIFENLITAYFPYVCKVHRYAIFALRTSLYLFCYIFYCILYIHRYFISFIYI